MNTNFYNRYHKKNTKVQSQIISKNNFTYRTLISLIEKYISKEIDVLDVGCGVGTIDFYISSGVRSVTGIDISKRAINLAKKSMIELKLRNLTFIQQDLGEINSIPRKYDLAICSEVIEHVKNDKRLLYMIVGSLKKNGMLIISTPSTNSPLYRLGLLKKFDNEVGHLRRYSQAEFENLLSDSGLQIEEIVLAEGLFRNMLFTFSGFGWIIKFLKYQIGEIFSYFDDKSIKFFGESNLYFVCKKI